MENGSSEEKDGKPIPFPPRKEKITGGPRYEIIPVTQNTLGRDETTLYRDSIPILRAQSDQDGDVYVNIWGENVNTDVATSLATTFFSDLNEEPEIISDSGRILLSSPESDITFTIEEGGQGPDESFRAGIVISNSRFKRPGNTIRPLIDFVVNAQSADRNEVAKTLHSILPESQKGRAKPE